MPSSTNIHAAEIHVVTNWLDELERLVPERKLKITLTAGTKLGLCVADQGSLDLEHLAQSPKRRRAIRAQVDRR